MKSTLEFLALLGAIDPALWDYIHPQGPLDLERQQQKVRALSPAAPDPVPLGAARVANEILRTASMDDAQGRPLAWVSDVIDDWCGTWWPRPWPWPFPWPPEPEPDPRVRWMLSQGQAVAAVVFGSAAARMRDGELRRVLAEGAERLADASVGEVAKPAAAKTRSTRGR